jgi:hypothetical protein
MTHVGVSYADVGLVNGERTSYLHLPPNANYGPGGRVKALWELRAPATWQARGSDVTESAFVIPTVTATCYLLTRIFI